MLKSILQPLPAWHLRTASGALWQGKQVRCTEHGYKNRFIVSSRLCWSAAWMFDRKPTDPKSYELFYSEIPFHTFPFTNNLPASIQSFHMGLSFAVLVSVTTNKPEPAYLFRFCLKGVLSALVPLWNAWLFFSRSCLISWVPGVAGQLPFLHPLQCLALFRIVFLLGLATCMETLTADTSFWKLQSINPLWLYSGLLLSKMVLSVLCFTKK